MTTPTITPLSVDQIATHAQNVLTEVATTVVGMHQPLRTALAAILAKGHVLFEDVPGLGKTLAARSLATALGLDFTRLQCTPDLLPSDITGSTVYNPTTRTFDLHPGPVFTGLFLADEINRTPPKTQSALLEAMAEHQVTIDGTTHPLPQPFHVIATSNPVEYEGTYPLPEAQLDRFMVRLAAGYPDRDAETDILTRRLHRQHDTPHTNPVIDTTTLLAMQAGIETITVHPDVIRYCVDLTATTRTLAELEVGASPRGSQTLLLVARALAAIDGRPYVLPDDIKTIAVPVLAHRLTLSPGSWAAGINPQRLITDLLDHVPGPTTVATP
ncbi:AAA family ATPase [Sanguibacter suaedae]|uniref:MoxR family ATPase n=1 Tax=Sanguibacter suaedae TaxID=2795737 RepID=A0A934ICJ3_9MICO|nr:MoxR family ATPase [Sanguibacter suaedae]MBI9116165.1 MoxR family ATPase [Sanguibacter suaedae]